MHLQNLRDGWCACLELPNVRAKGAPALGRQVPFGMSAPSTARRGTVARRWGPLWANRSAAPDPALSRSAFALHDGLGVVEPDRRGCVLVNDA